MKEELTTKMHSEFEITEEEDVINRIGSAIHAAMLLKIKTVQDFKEILKNYEVTTRDYHKYRKYWEEVGIFVKLSE